MDGPESKIPSPVEIGIKVSREAVIQPESRGESLGAAAGVGCREASAAIDTCETLT